jgi:hypothetical protein
MLSRTRLLPPGAYIVSESSSLREWESERLDLARAVRSATFSVDRRLVIKGSFRSGEFHLSRATRQTFSDVDLVLRDDSCNRHAWEAEVRDKLSSLGWQIRVSVQHFDSTLGIAAEDSRLLTAGELVRFWGSLEVPGFRPYIVAKTTISLLRTFEYRKSPHLWPDSRVVERAFAARTGFSATFTTAEATAMLSRFAPRSDAVRMYLNLLASADIENARAWYLRALRGSSINAWLKSRMAAIVDPESAE